MISFQDITYSYNKNRPIFENLNINLDEGNIYGLLGRNGAGKTTLLKIITGLLLPSRGECTVFTQKVSKRLANVLKDIFFIPEEIFMPPIRIKQYIESYAPFYPAFNMDKMKKQLQDMDISENTKLEDLSFGERKKFLIAFGVSTETRIFILDEPTNGLDIPAKSWLRKLLASTIGENQIFIISTHQARDMENLVDPIIILEKGEIVLHNTIAEIGEKIAMYTENDQPDESEYLYTEKTPAGWAVVTENLTGEETSIDIEVLFNTVTAKPEVISRLFEEGGTHDW